MKLRPLHLTNSTKARVIVAVNSLLGVAVAFGLPLSPERDGVIVAAVNAILGLFVHSAGRPAKR